MSNVTIEEFQNEKLARVQTAKKATWKEDSWVLEDGNVYTVDEKEGVTSKAAFSKQVIPLNITPREINWEQKSINEMTLGELRGYVKVLERQNLPTSDLWTEIAGSASGNPAAAQRFFYRHGHQRNRHLCVLWNYGLYHRSGKGRGHPSASGGYAA